MTEIKIAILFDVALLVAAIALLLYLILDYRRMCAASRFGSIEEAREDARRAIHAASGIYDIPVTERRHRNPNPTPLYGERR